MGTGEDLVVNGVTVNPANVDGATAGGSTRITPAWLAQAANEPSGTITVTVTFNDGGTITGTMNAVAPGLILPPAGEDEAYLARLARRLPLERHGEPEDVARAVVFLLESDFITGQVIFVDGGRHLKRLMSRRASRDAYGQ